MYDVTEKFNAIGAARKAVVLGIESSCDETAAAVVRSGREMLSNVISSQVPVHRRYGGVVPEIASRNHTMAVHAVVDEALKAAKITMRDVDAIAVTYGAGLAGALMVGVSAAKALAYAFDLPLIKVNHIEGHIAANYVAFPELKPPFLAAVASGGHTLIADVEDYNNYKVLGSTRDDALGEAFDKTARLLGLPYPGGPEVDKLAKQGKSNIQFVRPSGVSRDLSLSYSGLKTAVVNYVHKLRSRGETVPVADICASMQTAAVGMLVDAAVEAAQRSGRGRIVLAGGVAGNSFLRSEMVRRGEAAGLEVLFPPPVLCTDNAAMIASRAYFSAVDGRDLADLSLTACPSLTVGAQQ